MTPSRRRLRNASSTDGLVLEEETLALSSEPFTPLRASSSRMLSEGGEAELAERLRTRTAELLDRPMPRIPSHLTFPKELPPAGNLFRIQRTFYAKPRCEDSDDNVDAIEAALTREFQTP